MATIEDRMMGVGCFAAPRTLSRVLGRVMESYSLGGWEDALDGAAGPSEGVLALRRLMGRAGGSRRRTSAWPASSWGSRTVACTCRSSPAAAALARRNYTASVDELTGLRHRRLN